MKAFHFTIKHAHCRTGEPLERFIGTVAAEDENEAYEKLNKAFNSECYYALVIVEVTDEIIYNSHPL